MDEEREKENANKNCEVEKKESRCLLILNLQRPFVNSNLESLLNKFGQVERFWIDLIKTHCYVEYFSLDQAKEARNNLNGLKWPHEGKQLAVEFVPESEINLIIEKNRSPYEKEKINSPLKNNFEGQNSIQNYENIKNGTNTSGIPNNLNINNSFNKKSSNTTEEPTKTLDNLFKKTETKPHIYYLPLCEEEVEIKRKEN